MLDVGQTVLTTFAQGYIRAGEIVRTSADGTLTVQAFTGIPRPVIMVQAHQVEEVSRSTCERLGLLGN